MNVLERLINLPPEQQQALICDALKVADALPWKPIPGSQTQAYFSPADVTGYGGEAGPGKTALLVGLALTAHERTLFLRRTNKEARRIAEAFQKVIGHRNGLNTTEGIWRLGHRLIEYGGCEHEDDKQKFKGDPHDLIAFDEVVDFTRSQFEFIIQWNRLESPRDPNQRCRVVATFNPPTSPTGMWVIDYFGPWLNPRHPNPAEYGELRWFTTIDGDDTEVDGPGPHEVDGEKVMARSRTFIRGYLSENPYLKGYDATRAAAPRELRAAYRAGSFEASLSDAPGQLIPSAWVKAAQERWKDRPPIGVPQNVIGVDASGGGVDPMVLAIRHDAWFAPLIEVNGEDLQPERLGSVAAGIIVSYRRDDSTCIVDMGGGYGGPVYERLCENGIPTIAFKGAEKSVKRTADRKLGFFNTRSAAYWAFREALDPDQPGGSPIQLHDDPKLYADLTTPTFEVGSRGIKVEPKADLKERLGRSPDRGDAVIMAWSAEPAINPWKMRDRNPRPRVLRWPE